MDPLLAHIKSLSFEERIAFEAAVGTTIGYIRKAASTGQRLGETICMDIDRATNGKIPCETLRPDLAGRWSYLRGTHRKEVA